MLVRRPVNDWHPTMQKQTLAPSTPSKDPANATFSESVYRCVCGQLLPIAASGEVQCHACGRHCNVAHLSEKSAEITLPAELCEPVFKPSKTEAGTEKIDAHWGHFRLIEQIGEGGMGSVYRALDQSLQRYVAIKIIHGTSESADDSPHVQQLFQEARAQARVSHPHVVHIYFVDRHKGSPFFAMELVHGQTLKERLEKESLDYAEIVKIGLQVTDALAHALKYDILHGDIKPSNILQNENHDVKLSDFGLARRISEMDSDNSFRGGTPNYLSPETARQEKVDFRSDLYSLGVTLFELTFRRLPYSYTTKRLEERIQAHQFRPVEFPDEWPDHLPLMWKEILEKLLHKKPDERFSSYEELRQSLMAAKPAELPLAGRVLRGLAWLVDSALLFACQAIVVIPVQAPLVQGYLQRWGILDPIVHLVTALIVPLVSSSVIMRTGTTPGKKLFQLRIADYHGTPPSRARLLPRALAQYLFVWGFALIAVFESIHLLEDLTSTIIITTLVILDAIPLFLSPSRRALHDRFFRTDVVLETRRDEQQND